MTNKKVLTRMNEKYESIKLEWMKVRKWERKEVYKKEWMKNMKVRKY